MFIRQAMESFVDKNNRQIFFHAMSEQETETIATNAQQAPEKFTTNKLNNITNKSNDKSEQEQQKSNHRNNKFAWKQQQKYVYYIENAEYATTKKEYKQKQHLQQQKNQKQLEQEQQLTPTKDCFRFSALYSLVTTSATAATYAMRYASAYVHCNSDDDDDDDHDDYNDDNNASCNHSTQQHYIPGGGVRRSLDLKRKCKSLKQPQLSKLLHATCLRSCNGRFSSNSNSKIRQPQTGIRFTTGTRSVTGWEFFSAFITANSRSGSGCGTGCVFGVGLDTRSIFYLTLLFFIYCGVMMRASVAATAIANATLNANNTNANTNTNTHRMNAPTITAETLAGKASSISKYNTANNSPMINANKSAHGLQAQISTVTTNSRQPFTSLTTTATTANKTNANVVDSSILMNVSIVGVMYAMSPSMVAVNESNSLVEMKSIIKRDTAHVPDDDDDSAYRDDEFDEYEALINNRSAKGQYIGAPCFSNNTCESSLVHVKCDKETQICGCEKNYPVQLGLTKGCDKPKKLGEQCFYDETCMYNDENSLCIQVRHNAMCQCAHGFHSVSHTKPTRRIFCTKDLKELNSDLPTLLGVSTGIAVLGGLICMVLHLFSKTKYPRPRNFGDANLPPPIMYSSETGIPLTVQSGRPSSRSSLRSSTSIGSYGNRRASSGGVTTGGRHGMDGGSGSGTKGILVSTSRTGSRRPSLASVHSTSSSVRSYSMMRFEKEVQQKEIRQEMKLRLARLQHQQHLNQNKPQIVIGDTLQHHMSAGSALSRLSGIPTPSPLTPNSMDELLPAVDELQEYPPKSEDLATTIHQMAAGIVADSTLTAIKQAVVNTSSASITITPTTMGPEKTTNTKEAGTSKSGGLLTPATPSENNGVAAYIGPCSSSTEAL